VGKNTEICICLLLCFCGSVLTWWETDDSCPTSHCHFISRQSKLLQACSFKLMSSGVCREVHGKLVTCGLHIACSVLVMACVTRRDVCQSYPRNFYCLKHSFKSLMAFLLICDVCMNSVFVGVYLENVIVYMEMHGI